ncbi:MAG: Acyltransferase family protein, partial [Marmoricola sp.]|nr:Acyltransferase family protein [Marmoricola sp.]
TGGAYSRALGHRGARHLGFISYGFFCLHLPVLHLVMWVTGWTLFEGHFLGIWVVALAVSLVVAEAAHRWLEAPLTRFRNRGSLPAASTTEASSGARVT